LALGLYQLFFLDRVPHHAAVHVTVELVRKYEGQGASRYANAILQRALREGLPALPADPIAALAIEFSMPDWLVARWLEEPGATLDTLRERLKENRKVPRQWIRVNTRKTTVEEMRIRLDLPPEAVWGERWIDVGQRIGALVRSEKFRQGYFSVQNPAAELLANLLCPEAGHRVWDACAAPGGKSALLLERFPEIILTASDVDQQRIKAFSDLNDRLGLPSFQALVCDATKPEFSELFDRILLDVPCSNIGVIGRRPEVPLRLDPKTLEHVVERQQRILEGASQCLKMGGVLVYATCSPQQEETFGVIESFLRKHPEFVLDDASAFVDTKFVTKSCVLAHDASLGLDGFFGARLRKIS
jgi:16S rRNA (cytosine967-C5)-methyltransferase